MIENIKARLTDLEAERAKLEADLAAAKLANREVLLVNIRNVIEDSGYTPDEILPLLAPPDPKAKGKAKRSRASGSDPRQFPTYALADDPSRTYSRGKTPLWLREAMMAAGLDPDDRASRELFREQRMVRVP